MHELQKIVKILNNHYLGKEKSKLEIQKIKFFSSKCFWVENYRIFDMTSTMSNLNANEFFFKCQTFEFYLWKFKFVQNITNNFHNRLCFSIKNVIYIWFFSQIIWNWIVFYIFFFYKPDLTFLSVHCAKQGGGNMRPADQIHQARKYHFLTFEVAFSPLLKVSCVPWVQIVFVS